MFSVLFAVDGSDVSLRAAQKLAEMAAWWKPEQVHLVNVQPDPTLLAELLPHAGQSVDTLATAAGDRALAQARATLHDASLPVTTGIEFGDPASTIVRAADRLDSSLIAVGSHGAGALNELLTGSVTAKVLHRSTRPVLVIPSSRVHEASEFGPPRRPPRILVGMDGSSGAVAALRATLRIVPSFAIAPEIHLVAVYHRTPLDVEIAAMASAEMLADYQKRWFNAAMTPARGVLAEAKLAAVEHLVIGRPMREMKAMVAAQRCDLICIGTRSGGPIRDLVVGSTTTRVLHAAEVPVLVVPPPAM